MKNILFTLDNYHIGGVTSFVKTYVQALSKNNNAIILAREDNIKIPAQFFPGCRVFVIKKKVRFSLLGRLLDSVDFLIFLNKIYRDYNIDFVHFATTWSTLYSFLHPLTWKKKRIITFYGAYDLEEKSSQQAGDKLAKRELAFKKNIQKFTLTHSHKIITFSKYAKSLLVKHYGQEIKNKIILIPGFVDIKKIKYQRHQNFILINFGRAVQRKGLDILLKAIRNLINKGINVKLYVASPVEFYYWTQYLRIYEHENLFLSVHLIHAVSEKQKEQLCAMADAFIMPSVELETFGLTVIESLSYGLPVIGSSCGAIPETLKLVDQRLIFKNRSVSSLTKKLLWFYQLKYEEKEKLRQKCYEVIDEHFSFEKNKQKILDIYC